MNILTAPPIAVKTSTPHANHRKAGWARDADRLALNTCENEEERRGWLAANEADGETATTGFADWAGF